MNFKLQKLLARVVFCSLPALLFGTLFSVLNTHLGISVFVLVFLFGVSVTSAKPERGESGEI